MESGGKCLSQAEEYVQFVAVSAMPSAMTTRQVEEASADDEELSSQAVHQRKAMGPDSVQEVPSMQW